MIKKIALLIVLNIALCINAIPENPNDIPESIQRNWALVKHDLTVYSVIAIVGSIACYPAFHHIKNNAASYFKKRVFPVKQDPCLAYQISKDELDHIQKQLSLSRHALGRKLLDEFSQEHRQSFTVKPPQDA